MALRLAGAEAAARRWPSLAAAARHFSGSPAASHAGGGMKDSQDPNKTWEAYSQPAEPRHVAGEEELGSEKEIKWGTNIPASPGQAAEEIKYAGKGLAQSVQQAAGVLLSKAADAAAAAKRAVGLESDRPEMSAGTMGAAGKMEHAPPGFKSGGISSPQNVGAKYDEIAGTEKPHYPEGEQSVQDKFPEMATAAREQSNTPEAQLKENEDIRRELQGGASGGGASSSASVAEPGETGSNEERLYENLHGKGP